MSNSIEQFDPNAETPSFRVPPEMPVLPLRDTVLFPQAFMPLAVARESSVKLIDDAVASGQTIAVFAQREAGEAQTQDNPILQAHYEVSKRIRGEASDAQTRDLGIVAAGQLALHYWIAAFGTRPSAAP